MLDWETRMMEIDVWEPRRGAGGPCACSDVNEMYEFEDADRYKAHLKEHRTKAAGGLTLFQKTHPSDMNPEIYIANMIMAQPSRAVSRHAQDTLKTRSRHAQDTLKTLGISA